ncbi:DUF4123 domain-containing protein [Litoreibacter janthinus]|uniref:DUF4123 domain-containing protein n=1 Tax=Litoreibacter janthinus TaxID=670154 RepID=A0A1I6GQG4_9RHOB|nr:DUF4123 domain-containing protein [Litoreibacter janthinus]SFR44359.1 protein of unknown function [Litoreibacter janthinus]
MQPNENHDDVWVSSGPQGDTHDAHFSADEHFAFETFDGIEPLNQSDSLDGDLTSLGPLYAALFEPLVEDEAQPNDAALGANKTSHGDSPEVFAVLDAGRVMYLPEILSGSGLKHACLFKGEAFEELGDVAPWLVQLDAKSQFTRSIFLSSDVPWHLWRLEPGAFFRSSLSFDDLYKHFRKFTKVRLDDGKICYFRFWEPRWIIQILRTMEARQFQSFMDPLSAVIATNRLGQVGMVKSLR